MIFGVLNPEKIWHQHLVHLPTSPVYCSHFTLGNPKKSFFNSIIHSYRLFTLSQKKTNCYPLTHHTWKMSPHYLVKCTTFSSDWRYMRFSERWWIWNEPVVCWHWWLWKELVVVCGKWNVRQATLQQMFKVTTFCTGTCSSLFCRWSTVLSTMLCWNAAHVTTRRCHSTTPPYSELVLDTREQMKKMKNLCNFYKVVGRHFSGVVGKEVTVCFLR